ncbi:MAG: glutathione S-transferase family protein, partial [Oxalobacteraceae bacterium]
MHLYYSPVSSNARRVLLAAAHLGIDLDLVDIDLLDPEDRRRLQEVNPNGKVPVLVDDGFVLSESCAIMQYLADGKPGQTLYPTEPLARADVNRWMFWGCQHFTQPIGQIAWENVWKKMVSGEDADLTLVAHGAHNLARAAAVLD